MNVTTVYAEESPLAPGRTMVTVVYADGSESVKHLSGAVARRYVRQMRAKIGAAR